MTVSISRAWGFADFWIESGMVFIFFMVELAFMALALATCTRQCKTHATKLLGNHTGGLAGFALGHLQVHASTGEDRHMGWKTHLLINMHGLVKPKWNANITLCIYKTNIGDLAFMDFMGGMALVSWHSQWSVAGAT